MTAGPEATLERRCVKLARDAGGELVKLVPAHVRGLPDRLLLMPGGRATFVEFKAPQGRLTPLQEWWRDRIVGLGFGWAEVRDIDGFRALLEVSKTA